MLHLDAAIHEPGSDEVSTGLSSAELCVGMSLDPDQYIMSASCWGAVADNDEVLKYVAHMHVYQKFFRTDIPQEASLSTTSFL